MDVAEKKNELIKKYVGKVIGLREILEVDFNRNPIAFLTKCRCGIVKHVSVSQMLKGKCVSCITCANNIKREENLRKFFKEMEDEIGNVIVKDIKSAQTYSSIENFSYHCFTCGSKAQSILEPAERRNQDFYFFGKMEQVIKVLLNNGYEFNTPVIVYKNASYKKMPWSSDKNNRGYNILLLEDERDKRRIKIVANYLSKTTVTGSTDKEWKRFECEAWSPEATERLYRPNGQVNKLQILLKKIIFKDCNV